MLISSLPLHFFGLPSVSEMTVSSVFSSKRSVRPTRKEDVAAYVRSLLLTDAVQLFLQCSVEPSGLDPLTLS